MKSITIKAESTTSQITAVGVSLFHITNAAGISAIALSAIADRIVLFNLDPKPTRIAGEVCILATTPILLTLWLHSLYSMDHSKRICIVCNFKSRFPALTSHTKRILNSPWRLKAIGYSSITGHVLGIGLLASSKASFGNPIWLPSMNRIGIACAVIGNLGIFLTNLRDKTPQERVNR